MRNKTNRVRVLGGALLAVILATLGWGFSFITNDDTGLPIKWTSGPIQMTIIADNSTALSDGLTRAGSIQDAMISPQRGWNRYLGNVAFVPHVQAGGAGADGNGQNEIFFSDSPYNRTWDSNTLALTTTWSSGNERAEADIIFNTSFKWDSYRGNQRSGVLDLQRVALHELGHVLGLDHPDDDGQTVTAVMNSRISNVDSLVTDDINGAQSMYGPPGVPANDNFANAISITLGNGNTATVNGFNTNATKEAGEPNHADNAGGHSVWWKWTAPGDGSVSLDTRGSYFDSTLAVYTGSALASLTAVASNDDIKNGIVQASFVSFTAKANTTYWFAVDGFRNQGDPTADSAAVILSLLFAPTGVTAPAITMQPTSITATAGNSASFTVTATGSAPLSYQWYFGSAAISGATSATYSIANAQSANGGSYFVTVTNSAGSVSSTTVTLTVSSGTTMPPSSGWRRWRRWWWRRAEPLVLDGVERAGSLPWPDSPAGLSGMRFLRELLAGKKPWVFLTVCLAALIIQLNPGWRGQLIYDRTALERGEIWRVWTGHLVHFGWGHFVADAGLLFILGWLLESRHRVFSWLALGLMPAFISAVVFWFDPAMVRYGGLSAVNLGMLLYLAAQGWQRNWTDWFWPAVLAIYVGEVIFESVQGGRGGGMIRFDDPAIHVATSAHLASAAYALLAWLISWGRNFLFSVRKGERRSLPADT